MLFYILKVKGEGCSLSITAQEWGKRWRELKGYNKEKEDEEGKNGDFNLTLKRKKKIPAPWRTKDMVILYIGYFLNISDRGSSYAQ